LQAPACHENMVKVAGYILGEFGNLIAGDQRSSPIIQFQLLNSKYHLCSTNTRALLLTTYVKFINLFPEIKSDIQAILKNHSNIRSADAELQQRTVEYLQLSQIASPEVLACVLEEMPPFTERESSILATLKKKKPGMTAPEKSTKEKSTSLNTSGAIKDTSADLLGLNSSSVGVNSKPQSNSNLLVDLFGDSIATESNNVATNGINGTNGTTDGVSIIHSNEECLEKLLCRNNGIIFENSLIQIGVKSEYKQNLGRLSLFYGNKTNGKFVNFLPTITCPGSLSLALNIQAKPAETAIEGGAQVQQLLNAECIDHFNTLPSLTVQFTSNGTQHRIELQLPITINKFFEPTSMNSENFFQRWKNLNNPGQEAQKIFKSKYSMDGDNSRTKLSGFGFQLLENVDPNPENFVCAAIFHSRQMQVGCLLRLEPNKQAQMYRLTVRSSKNEASARICDLLQDQF